MSLFKVATLTYHVKRIIDDTPKLDSKYLSDQLVECVLDALKKRHREYQFETKERLRESVREVLKSVVPFPPETIDSTPISNITTNKSTPKNSNGGGCSPAKLQSLNQTMISNYRSNGSKRQRPAELEASAVDGQICTDSTSPGDANAAAANSDLSKNSEGNISTAAINTIEGVDGGVVGSNSKLSSSSSSNTTEGRLSTGGADEPASTTPVPPRRNNSISRKFAKRARYSNGSADDFVNISSQGVSFTDSQFLSKPPMARLADLAGIEPVMDQIRELVFYPVQYPELYAHLGVSPPSGILLHGPSGCGKTMLANAIAGELGLPFYKVMQRSTMLSYYARL